MLRSRSSGVLVIRLSILSPPVVPLVRGLTGYTEGSDLNTPDDGDTEDYDGVDVTFWINDGIDFIITSIALWSLCVSISALHSRSTTRRSSRSSCSAVYHSYSAIHRS
jgi:hypothetical protein